MEQEEQLKIIGAGFGRTGTESLQIALNTLGYKCYHMHELMKYKDVDIWYDILMKPKKKRNWNESLFAKRDYRATVDWPTTSIYEDLLIENPSAKIILTIRDTPDQWHKSVINSIWKLSLTRYWWQFRLLAMLDSYRYKNGKIIDDLIWNGVFDGRIEDKQYAINIYKKHIENVKKKIAKKRLLIMNVKEGWKPLCKFLNVDIPNMPFPRGNTTADKEQEYPNLVKTKNKVNTAVIILFIIVIGCLYKYYKTTKSKIN